MGVIFGAMLSVNQIVFFVFRSKIFQAVFDFLMLVSYALLYFCVTLAYKNGEYHSFDSILTLTSFLLYIVAVYKPTSKLIDKTGRKLNLKLKSLKKLLHLDM